MSADKDRVKNVIDFMGGFSWISVEFRVQYICVDKETVSLMNRIIPVNSPDYPCSGFYIAQFQLFMPVPGHGKIRKIALVHTIGKFSVYRRINGK